MGNWGFLFLFLFFFFTLNIEVQIIQQNKAWLTVIDNTVTVSKDNMRKMCTKWPMTEVESTVNWTHCEANDGGAAAQPSGYPHSGWVGVE